MQVAPHAVRTVGVHGPTGQALHTVDMNALDQAGGADGRERQFARDPAEPHAWRWRRVHDAVPGPLAPPTPMGLTGALGSSMRAQRMRPPGRMPRVAGAMGGMGALGG